jgi:acyl-CoA thioester hydrolase
MKYDETEIRVRFNEVDSWGIVWHGHYIAYLRRADGPLAEVSASASGLPNGIHRPVVDLKCSYKEPARLDEEILIRTTVLKPTKAALIFNSRFSARETANSWSPAKKPRFSRP